LFNEWEKELSQYSDQGLRRTSERQLTETKQKYKRLTAKMDADESKNDKAVLSFYRP